MEINELAAKAAHEATSNKPYIEGSATELYEATIGKVREIVDKKLAEVDEMYHVRINGLYRKYCYRLADNINKLNENRATCPSVLVAGPDGVQPEKKQRQLEREKVLMDELKQIEKIPEQIAKVGDYGIRVDDPKAIDKLNEIIQELTEENDRMKLVNQWYRNHNSLDGCALIHEDELEDIRFNISRNRKPFPFLSSEKIRRLKRRVTEIEKLRDGSLEGWEFDGGSVKVNNDLGRLQIIFDYKPNDDEKRILKLNGFKWSPNNRAWQRILTAKAYKAAESLRFLTPIKEGE